MKLIRLQDNTPSVYTEESRDFQLFCRLYDCVNNGFLYDTDTITNIVDTSNCRSVLLPLLQTKIGFFGDTSTLDDRSLRLILQAFPVLIKNKGSLKAIKYAINVFLKILGIDTAYSISIKDNFIVSINIEYELLDESILNLLLEPIIPAGMGIEILYSASIEKQLTQMSLSDSIKVLYISDKYNSNLRRCVEVKFEVDTFTSGTTSVSILPAIEGTIQALNENDTIVSDGTWTIDNATGIVTADTYQNGYSSSDVKFIVYGTTKQYNYPSDFNTRVGAVDSMKIKSYDSDNDNTLQIKILPSNS